MLRPTKGASSQSPTNPPSSESNPGSTVPASPAPEVPQSTPLPTQNSDQTTQPAQNSPPPTPAAEAPQLPLRSPDDIDLKGFNQLVGDRPGKPVEDMKRFFVKQVILDDQTTVDVTPIKVPGFIGISDSQTVTDPRGNSVSGHEDIAKFLARDGLYICTYQWNKEDYGIPVDTRQALDEDTLVEVFMKNEGHHSGAVVPAQRFDQNGKLINSYATFNEPNDYHRGMFGKDGYVAVAQRLVFPNFVTPQQARGYADSIICWMGLLNPFVQFPSNYNGGDPTHICDRASLKEFMRNGLLASLGDADAIAYFKDPLNKCYCAEFMFVNLNTPVYPFNRQGLALLLDGDMQKADQVLALQTLQNKRQANALSTQTHNPEFAAFNIPMPLVPEDLPPLDVLMQRNGQNVDSNSIPFPPFLISQVIRRAFRTMLPRHAADSDKKMADAQARVFRYMKPALIQQLGLGALPATDLKIAAVNQFLDQISDKLDEPFTTYEAFAEMVNGFMAQADAMLMGDGDRARFVPPRIYVDLGQNDGDEGLPKGWGFHLETVGALVARSTIA
jgi:hypothetical protein